ncbi:MAG: YbaK/EbsC family protein [Caldilineaceae bacterium]
MGDLKASAQRVQDTLSALGFTNQVFELTEPARSAPEAATALGCAVGQIAKSLVFKGVQSERAILVIASGAHRVNEKLMATHVGEKLTKPDANFVREQTGFAIGGIPPVGHTQPLQTYIDEELLHQPQIWAAAGHPHALFALTPAELVRMTGGHVVTMKA